MKAILGEKFVQLFCPFSIDKLREMWYNGKFGASRTWAPRSRQSKKGRLLALFIFRGVVNVIDLCDVSQNDHTTATAFLLLFPHPIFKIKGSGDSKLCGATAIRTLFHFFSPQSILVSLTKYFALWLVKISLIASLCFLVSQ